MPTALAKPQIKSQSQVSTFVKNTAYLSSANNTFLRRHYYQQCLPHCYNTEIITFIGKVLMIKVAESGFFYVGNCVPLPTIKSFFTNNYLRLTYWRYFIIMFGTKVTGTNNIYLVDIYNIEKKHIF
jgi:hypothetical protein